MPARYQYNLALSVPTPDSDRLTLCLRDKTQSPNHPDLQIRPAQNHALIIANLAESNLPHPFLRQRLTTALPEILPPAFHLQQTRITAINNQASLTRPTPQTLQDINHFLAFLAPHLTAQNLTLTPVKPHIPLEFWAHAKTTIPQIFGWTAEQLILWESDQFTGQNRTVKSWPLPPPIQGSLDFNLAA